MGQIEEVISSASTEELDFPPPSEDHAGHVVYLTLKGHTKLAADHLLHKEMKDQLEGTVGKVIRQLNLEFGKALLEEEDEKGIVLCARIYDVLVNTALNLLGLERKIVGFSDDEAERTLREVSNALEDLENVERTGIFGDKNGEASVARAVINALLLEMKEVMGVFYRSPGSMVAHVAKEIENSIDKENVMGSFLESAKKQIQENVYYKMGEAGMCKFGNDYALGLRWLRHLGFVQVSTNPSLAAIAYDDDPSQWKGYRGENLCPDFETIAKQHVELFEDPEAHGDDITAYATEVSIWRNLAVFRPIAIASDMFHGMISLQLNPKIADSYEESVRYALKFYGDAEDFLREYDAYLLWGYSENVERGRPNIVFKVAASSPAAIDITRKLESFGIGTNNTVTFTVSQETELILAKMKGRAMAVKKGIPLTTVYETNMGGRLDDHIRELQIEHLLRRALEKGDDAIEALRQLAGELDASEEVREKPSLEEKVVAVSGRRYLRPLDKEPLIDFLSEKEVPFSSREKVRDYLATLEKDIEYCGILVTKRVYAIFFSPENRSKWMDFLQSKYGLSEKQAEDVMKGIDILPASKRNPRETFLTLGRVNMTHTEFPNHQMNVLMTSAEASFNVGNHRESVLKGIDASIVRRLTEKWTDINNEFIRAYELTSEQQRVLKEAGIHSSGRYGDRGIEPAEWSTFGATAKTMDEFSGSYEKFRKRCGEFLRGIAKNHRA